MLIPPHKTGTAVEEGPLSQLTVDNAQLPFQLIWVLWKTWAIIILKPFLFIQPQFLHVILARGTCWPEVNYFLKNCPRKIKIRWKRSSHYAMTCVSSCRTRGTWSIKYHFNKTTLGQILQLSWQRSKPTIHSIL